MSIQKFDKNMNIVAALDDEPNDVGGLTSAELKAKFDEGGKAIKDYINETVIPAIDRQESDTDTLKAAKHTHSNKALLDTYTQTEANLADAVTKKHSHPNKEVLDGIAAVTQELGDATDKVPSESAVSAAIAAAGNLPAGGVAGQALVKKSNESYDTQWDTLTAARVGAYSKDEVDAFLSEKPNPNLLDNWYFGNPVNQRGQTSYTGAVYGIDRWNGSSLASITLESDGVLFVKRGNGIPVINTFLEKERFVNGYYTISVCYYADNKLELSKNTFYLTVDDTIDTASINVYSSWYMNFYASSQDVSNGIYRLRFYNPSGAIGDSCKLIAVKLELGSQQTLAHQENGVWVLNEIPDYGEQLARCQRYFQTFATESLRPTDALDFRPVMRTNPALSAITVGGKTLYTASADL